jgi:poly [ADP-ribose] polymerase
MYDALSHLTHIEHASKLLLGALYRQMEVNPVDYIFEALGSKVEFVSESFPEFDLLHEYIKNTSQNCINYTTHKVNIFRVERKGELEKSEDYNTTNFPEEDFCDVANRRLLFHGSALVNFIGILSQGLRIAPPEAPATGYMLGKGVYFADMFSKSYAYAQNRFHGAESSLLLICEVALGN